MYYSWLLIALLHLCGTCLAVSDSIDYTDYYYGYGDIYDETGEEKSILSKILSPTVTPDPEIEFRGSMTCTEDYMTLVVGRTRLPKGLGFLEESYSVDGPNKMSFSNETCIQLTLNETHHMYRVSLFCHHAVGHSFFGTVTVYSHQVLMTNDKVRGKANNISEIYTIVMECEKSFGKDNRTVLKPEFRLYEHRGGLGCSSSICPHGDLCLPKESITGYFCECSTGTCGAECPKEFYGCSRHDNDNSTAVSTSLICIKNEQLCNLRFDCPFMDDELCADVWSPWSSWSACSKTCGMGTQIRRRSCTNTFTQDPSRCSRRCISEYLDDEEREERKCDTGSCGSVLCRSEEMVVSIPVEIGMTRQSVIGRMHLRGSVENECKPSTNATHAMFKIPLHKCNTSKRIENNLVFYTNEIIYEAARTPSSLIQRDYGHSYVARCQYKRRHTVGIGKYEINSGNVEELAALLHKREKNSPKQMNDLIEHFTSGDGQFDFKMNIYHNGIYSTPYNRGDYPLTKRLGERMYLDVSINTQDEDLLVFIHKCWATPSNGKSLSSEDKQYTFIENGCAVDHTVLFHNTKKFSDRFSIEAFRFADPDQWFVYFRCDVIVCDVDDNEPECRRQCGENGSFISPSHREKRDLVYNGHAYGHVIQGPIIVLDFDQNVEKHGKRSGENFGIIEHKLLTYKDTYIHQLSDGTVPPGNDGTGFWKTTFLYVLLIGIACLLIGISLGFAVRLRHAAGKKERTCDRHSRKDFMEEDALCEEVHV